MVFVSILLIVWLICPEILTYRVLYNSISLRDLVGIFLVAMAIFQLIELSGENE